MSKKYSIEVWDITFYKVNEEGDPLLDKDGKVVIFDAPDYDCSMLAEGLTQILVTHAEDDLVEKDDELENYQLDQLNKDL